MDCAHKIHAEWVKANRDYYNNTAKVRRQKRKIRAIEYMGGVCQDCHGKFHQAAFDFHHLEPHTKERDPGLMMGRSDKLLFEELDKCVLLCANCHRIRHANEGY